MTKTLGLLFLTILLCAFNRFDFNDVMLGTPITEVTRRYGEPYAVYDLGDGVLQFEYIERVSMNNELVYVNYYYLTMTNDKVTSKCFREENRPPYDQMYRKNPFYPTYP